MLVIFFISLHYFNQLDSKSKDMYRYEIISMEAVADWVRE